jgi:hypothetical protein
MTIRVFSVNRDKMHEPREIKFSTVRAIIPHV